MFRQIISMALIVGCLIGGSAFAGERAERRAQTSAQFQDTFDALVPQGYVPIYVKGFMVQGEARYDTVYEILDGVGFEMRTGLTDDEFRNKDQGMLDQGYRRVCYSRYRVRGAVYHAAIWHKE